MARTRGAEAGRPGNDAVVKATGKDWDSWFRLLDAAAADKLDHPGIVRILGDGPGHGVSGWWQQMITVAYEQARGLRKLHERPDGFQVSRSKTIGAPVSRLYAAWKTPAARRRWLDESRTPLTVRKATANKQLRMACSDGATSVEVSFTPTASGKTQVVVTQSKLRGATAAARQKAFWGKALESLEKSVGR